MLKHICKLRLKRIQSFSAIASIVTVLLLTLYGTGQPLSANTNPQAIAESGEEALLLPDANFLTQASESGVTQQNRGSPDNPAEFLEPDAQFIKDAESIGMTGENWDTPEYIASAMPHVYKFLPVARLTISPSSSELTS